MLRSLFTLIIVFVSFYAFAQNGTIDGIVTDAKSGETVIL
jgi:hypothetical protein